MADLDGHRAGQRPLSRADRGGPDGQGRRARFVEHRSVRSARGLRQLGPLPDARPARLAAAGRLQHGHTRDAEPGAGGDRHRDGPRDPRRLSRRPRPAAGGRHPVPRLFARPLGRRCAGHRDNQFHAGHEQRRDAQQCADEAHRTDHPDRPQPDALRGVGRGSGHADRALQDRHPVAAQSGLQVLRVRLPRRQRADPRLHHRDQPALRGAAQGAMGGAGKAGIGARRGRSPPG